MLGVLSDLSIAGAMAALSGCEKSCRGIGQLSAAHIPNRRPPASFSEHNSQFNSATSRAEVTLAYLKGKDAECAQPICVNTGVYAADWYTTAPKGAYF